MYVLDTNCIIYYSQEDFSVGKIITGWINNEELLLTSAIVEAELFAWPKFSKK